MPSGSTGRYQSRLFNFLNRQSLRLTEQFDRTVRHVKVAAVWGVQILLYPVYLLVQTSLSVGRQLRAEAEAGWPKLKEFTQKEPQQETPLAADTPIQRVLEELKVGTLKVEGLKQFYQLQPANLQPTNLQPTNLQPTNLEPTNLASNGYIEQSSNSPEERCVIQGVASLVTTRSLVLVTVENQILDILTPQQQHQLAAKIRWEVADFLHQRRLVQSSRLQKATPRLSELDRPRVLWPVRLFWHIMAWVQTSPIAIAANLFQESTLVGDEAPGSRQILPYRPALKRHQLPASKDSVIANQLDSQGVLTFLDRTVAELESHQLVPGTEALITLRDSLQTRWNSSPLAKVPIQGSKWTLAASRSTSKIQSLIQNLLPSPQSPATETSQTRLFQIQALIYAAVDYFFGKRDSDLPGTDSQELSLNLANPQGKVHQLFGRHSPSLSPGQTANALESVDTSEADLWLSWSDLYGESDSLDEFAHHAPISQDPSSRISSPKSQAQLPEAFSSKIPIKPRNSAWHTLKRFLRLKPVLRKRAAPNSEKLTHIPHPSVSQTSKLTTTQNVPPLATLSQDKGRISRQKKTSSSVAVSSPHSTSVSPVGKESNGIGFPNTRGAIVTPSSHSQNTDIEPAPDWIETQATPSGYVKHPLEQVLEWLDHSMLWVEELVVKVWRWFWQRRR